MRMRASRGSSPLRLATASRRIPPRCGPVGTIPGPRRSFASGTSRNEEGGEGRLREAHREGHGPGNIGDRHAVDGFPSVGASSKQGIVDAFDPMLVTRLDESNRCSRTS
jgi:hypothetical protein